MSALYFSLGIQGDKSPHEYIEFARCAESLDFDRIYVYDDLLYYPAFPVLATMGQHTQKIKLGACLLNGFYRHPAVLVSNYAYLYRMIGKRAIMGLGRGAFFDLLGMETSEAFTREGFEETLGLVSHLLYGNKEAFTGKYFRTTSKAFLKVPSPAYPQLVTATWNVEMAKIAGRFGTALQIAQVWSEKYMVDLYDAFESGMRESGITHEPDFAIGGMVCVGKTEKEALEKARKTVVIYLPYLQTILKSHNIDPDSERIQRISALSKSGDIAKAASLMSDQMVKALSLTGTPEQVAEKITSLRHKVHFKGVLFSPPYGTSDNITQNLRFLKEEVMSRVGFV